MALINCGNCGNNISDMASLCFKCGFPKETMQESMAAVNFFNKIQATSKKFKTFAFISGGLIIFSFVWMVNILMDPFNTELNPIPLLMFFIGLLWFIVENRLRI